MKFLFKTNAEVVYIQFTENNEAKESSLSLKTAKEVNNGYKSCSFFITE